MGYLEKLSRVAVLFLVAVFLIVGATACSTNDDATDDPPATESDTGSDSGSNGDADADSNGDGQSSDGAADESDPAMVLVETKCSMCHSLDRVWSAQYDRAGWESTVDRMIANGLVLTDDEYETIVVYLTNQ